MTDWCERCDLPSSQCMHSVPVSLRDPYGSGKAMATGPTIMASTNSPCANECGTWISGGDLITYSSEAGGWCHEACTERESSYGDPRPPTDPGIFG